MPKIVDHPEYKHLLLDRSFNWIATHGLAEVSMRKLAEELEVTTGVLYHYFSGRTELLESLIQRIATVSIAEGRYRVQRAKTAQAKVQQLAQFLSKEEPALRKILYLLCDSIRDPKLLSVFKKLLTQYKSALSEELKLASAEEEDLVLSFLIGSLILRLLRRSHSDPKSFFETGIRLLTQRNS